MRKLDKVFFVTSIEMRPLSISCNPHYIAWMKDFYQDDGDPLIFKNRTWLWLPTYEEAEDFVLNNRTDIAEGGTNKWAAIEGIRPICVDYKPSPQVFFEFVGDWETDGHYKKMEGWPKPVLDYYEKSHLVRMVTTIG